LPGRRGISSPHGEELAPWGLRVVEAPRKVHLRRRRLDDEFSSSSSRARCSSNSGIILLEALRDDDAPMPLARDFMGPWCGLTPNQFRDGLWELRQGKFIQQAGKHGRMNLYMRGRKAV
jgi:hypothetical protein